MSLTWKIEDFSLYEVSKSISTLAWMEFQSMAGYLQFS